MYQRNVREEEFKLTVGKDEGEATKKKNKHFSSKWCSVRSEALFELKTYPNWAKNDSYKSLGK